MGAGTGDLGRLPRPCCGRYCGVPVAAILRFVAVLLLVSVPATRSQQAGSKQDTPEVTAAAGHGGEKSEKLEAYSIQPRDIPFLQKKGEWQQRGHGISMLATGEPKSGTSWLGRLIPQLALELCGSPTNRWCEMGGLAVFPSIPTPKYEFEMLKADEDARGSSTLFLHFKGFFKHFIPGMVKPHHGCAHRGRSHQNTFQDYPPCISGEVPTRKRLRACLWDTSDRCLGQASKNFRR
ncbi:unnamed protein product [Pylaiella littoralis]